MKDNLKQDNGINVRTIIWTKRPFLTTKECLERLEDLRKRWLLEPQNRPILKIRGLLLKETLRRRGYREPDPKLL